MRSKHKAKLAEEIWVHGIELEFPDCQFIDPEILSEGLACIPLTGHYIKTFRMRDVYDEAVCSKEELDANEVLFYALVKRYHILKYGCQFIVAFAFSKCKAKLEMACAMRGIELA